MLPVFRSAFFPPLLALITSVTYAATGSRVSRLLKEAPALSKYLVSRRNKNSLDQARSSILDFASLTTRKFKPYGTVNFLSGEFAIIESKDGGTYLLAVGKSEMTSANYVEISILVNTIPAGASREIATAILDGTTLSSRKMSQAIQRTVAAYPEMKDHLTIRNDVLAAVSTESAAGKSIYAGSAVSFRTEAIDAAPVENLLVNITEQFDDLSPLRTSQ